MGQGSVESHSSPVSFAERLAGSDRFGALFDEGMTLVGEAAAYLDGIGRVDVKGLERAAALAYAVESMRLTTRLIHIASWLLLQRSVNRGELTRQEAAVEQRRIKLDRQEKVSPEDVLALLPLRLCVLIEASLRLQARVIHLDGQLYRGVSRRDRPAAARSPVRSQIEVIRAAFASERYLGEEATSCRN